MTPREALAEVAVRLEPAPTEGLYYGPWRVNAALAARKLANANGLPLAEAMRQIREELGSWRMA